MMALREAAAAQFQREEVGWQQVVAVAACVQSSGLYYYPVLRLPQPGLRPGELVHTPPTRNRPGNGAGGQIRLDHNRRV